MFDDETLQYTKGKHCMGANAVWSPLTEVITWPELCYRSCTWSVGYPLCYFQHERSILELGSEAVGGCVVVKL